MTQPVRDALTRIAVGIARLAYVPIKHFVHTRNKIVFISRQEDSAPLDLQLVSDAFRQHYPEWEQVMLTKRLGTGWVQQARYIGHILRQMVHIAGARLVVLDSYCIAVSILRHKPEVQIVQMWHALGALKRFAYSVVNGPDGADDEFANIMHMHENYDRVFASAEVARHPFAEAFNTDIDRVIVQPLPRVDLLRNTAYQRELRERIFSTHPELRDRHVVLFAPTFRTAAAKHVHDLQREFAHYDVLLIPKAHPFVSDESAHSRRNFDDVTAFDLLSVADAVITDYSSIAFEAAVLGRELYFYTPDLDHYATIRNFYLDFRHEMPGLITASPAALAAAVAHHDADVQRVSAFAQRFVAPTQNATESIVDCLSGLVEVQD